MQPQIHLFPMAIVMAALSSFILGTLWQVFLFKKMNKTKESDAIQSVQRCLFDIAIRLAGTFVMAFVFAHNIAAWDPRSWGYESEFLPPLAAAMQSAFFTWLGFYVPQDVNRISLNGKSWKTFMVDTIGNLLTLIVSACILVYWR